MNKSAYHTDYLHVSQTMLKLFARRRQLFHKTYVTCEIEPEFAKRKMDVGTVAHAALLEPYRVDELVIEIPDELLSGDNKSISSKAAKNWVAEQQRAGKIPLKAKEIADVRNMARSILESKAEWFKVPSLREHVIRWTDESGLKCRMQGDIIIEMPKKCIGIDVKTTGDSSPYAFEGVANSQKYFLQDSHYRAGIEAQFGKPVEFYFLVVEDSEPYTTAVHACEDSREADHRRSKLLDDLKGCYESDDWREPWESTINRFRIFNRG